MCEYQRVVCVWVSREGSHLVDWRQAGAGGGIREAHIATFVGTFVGTFYRSLWAVFWVYF